MSNENQKNSYCKTVKIQKNQIFVHKWKWIIVLPEILLIRSSLTKK